MLNKSTYIWGLLSRFGPSAIQLLATMVLARYLSPEEFGTIGVLGVLFSIANTLIDSGLGGSLVKENKLTSVDCSTIFIFNASVSVAIYCLLFAFSGLIESYFAIDGLSTVVKIVSLMFITSSIGIVPRSLLMRDLKFKEISIISIIAIIIASALAIFMAANGYGVYALVYFYIANITLTSLLTWVVSKYKLSFDFSFDSLKRLMPFGIYTTLVSIIDSIYENILTVFTGKYMSINSAGYLSQAKKIEEVLTTTLAQTIGNVSFPIITRMRGDRDKFCNETFSISNTVIVFTFPVLLIVLFFATEIILLLFGQNWIDAAFYLRTLVFAGMFCLLETLTRSYLKAYNRVKVLAKVTLIKRIIAIVIIVGALMISPELMIYAYILSAAIAFALNALYFCREVQLSIIMFFSKTAKSLIPVVVFALALCLVFWSFSSSLLCKVLISIFVTAVYYLLLISKVRKAK